MITYFKPYYCTQTNDYYQIQIMTEMITLYAFDRNSRYHITVYKSFLEKHHNVDVNVQ